MSIPKLPPDYVFVSPWGRLKLVPPKVEDDPNNVTLRTDPETRRYLPYMPTDLTLDQCRQRRQEHSSSNEIWDFSIHFNSDQRSTADGTTTFIGECAISHIDGLNKTGHVGVIIRSDLYRNFIATEALYCNLVIAFEHPQLELYRVSFVTAAINVRMRSWLERFGIALEYLKKEAGVDGKGGRLDVVVYTIFKRDWPVLRTRMTEELDKRLGKS